MTIEILTVPHQQPGDAPSPLMVPLAEVTRREMIGTLGDDDLADTPELLTSAYGEQRYRSKLALVALDAGRAVGGGWFMMPRADNTHVVEGNINVVPQADPAQVVPSVWEVARAAAVAAGRSTARLFSTHRLHGYSGDYLVPRTGVLRLPLDPFARAVKDLGFVLEQVERHSVMDVADGLERAEAELPAARAAAGTAYRTLSWTGPTPEEHRAGMASLMARLSTDAPNGGLEIEAEVWDADRVAEVDRVAAGTGRPRMATVAQHVATGELVAYTLLAIPADRPQVAFQDDTLVHADHRGHRLGMLVKALNLRQLARRAPQVRRVHTWNAGENEHMLAINVPLGFRERSAGGAWQLGGLT